MSDHTRMTHEHLAREQARIAAEEAKRAVTENPIVRQFEVGPVWSRPELEAIEAERVRRAAAAALDAEQAALRRVTEGR